MLLLNFIASGLSGAAVIIIIAVVCYVISIVITAIITFVITAHYYKRKYNKQTAAAVTQRIVSRTGTIEYEEITKTSVPDNPTYDVAMTSNPAYGHNVKIDQASDYYN